jgi:HK97 family phage major capsid protein
VGKVIQLTMDQFHGFVNRAVDARWKEAGLDRIDIKHAMFPFSREDGTPLSDREIKAWPKEKRTIEMVRALFTHDYTRATAMSGAVGPEGGYLLPEEFRQDVIRQIQVIPVIRGVASVFPVTTMSGSIPKMVNFVQTFWEGENATFTPTQFGTGAGQVTLGQLLWRVWRLDGFMAASRELFDDAGFNIYNLFVQLFATAFRVAEEKAFMTGSGVGQPQGIRNAGVTNTIAQAGTTLNSLAYRDIVNLVYAVQPQYRNGAVFLMHNQVVAKVRGITDSNGRPIWVEPTTFGDITQGQPARLLGYPVLIQMHIPTNLGAGTNASEIWFLNPKWYYVFDRQQFAAETTLEGAGAFEKHQQILKLTQRVDGQLALQDPAAVMTGVL